MVRGGRIQIRAEDIRPCPDARVNFFLTVVATAMMLVLLLELPPFACLAVALLTAATWSWWLEQNPESNHGSGRSEVDAEVFRIRHCEFGSRFYWLPKSFSTLSNDTGEPNGV